MLHIVLLGVMTTRGQNVSIAQRVSTSPEKKVGMAIVKSARCSCPVLFILCVLLQPYHTHTMRIGLVKTDWPIAKNSHTHQPTKPQRITPLLSRSSAYAAHDLFIVMIHLRLHTFISLTVLYD
jgi:hypothetical protein